MWSIARLVNHRLNDVLRKALEAAELQVQASTALGEAADALAEEEQVRLK
jgi:hypothetical protein